MEQWIVQLMKMFYDEEHILPMVGEAMNVEFLKFTKDKIRRGMKIIVREGSTIPSDPITERTEALDLYKMQAIGILQLHKKLKFPNPEQSAQEAMLWWKQGQLPQAQPTPPVIPNQPFGGQPMQPGANPMQPASNPAPAVAPTPAPVQ